MSNLEGEYVPSTRGWVRDQVEAFEASDGADANVLRGTNDPIIVVTNRGARSGKIRKTPLMRVEKDGRYLVVGSRGGAPTHPQWVHNLRAHPEVELQDGAHRTAYVARELSGDERAQWWQYAVETWAQYAVYQAKTERLIPIFLLEPAG
ncbi:nitroreductase family deazaflavin-dependent oxidoreductase [Xylanimonas protaetiae]|uniref:Nitroreductase family deazaflavin-dependent oxidoreductase n=1 Tax=Xylanimonas protaetiae TaxID=2509457 RepID=A0A4P6F6V5_9MICO|nr:nitroreductase family deazaflavin-dependent oxidoreductase [Xylanimonas protaetiae]QAY71185.1 nitroreductase family deazaflavin-dependent oxidoreductase [Xylanimonas protaetiae]